MSKACNQLLKFSDCFSVYRQVIIRARNLRAAANFIPAKSFRARKHYYSNEVTEFVFDFHCICACGLVINEYMLCITEGTCIESYYRYCRYSFLGLSKNFHEDDKNKYEYFDL